MSLLTRVIITAALLAALGWVAHIYNEHQREVGRGQVRVQWQAERLEQQQAALKALDRRDEQAAVLAKTKERIDHDLVQTRAALVVAEQRAADGLQRLDAALAGGGAAGADPAAAGSADDPRAHIIGECARTLAEVDGRAQRLAGEKGALQRYASEVCLAANAPP